MTLVNPFGNHQVKSRSVHWIGALWLTPSLNVTHISRGLEAPVGKITTLKVGFLVEF